MVHRTIVAAFTFVIVALPRPAWASSITQIVGFSGSGLDLQLVVPFDPSLGGLDSVSVSMLGSLTVQGQTGSNIVLVPIPYTYQVSVTQSFVGLAGQFFDFGNPASFTFLGSDPGVGTGFHFSTNFSYVFQFTALSDFAGFTVPLSLSSAGIFVPPPTITGNRADFLQGFLPNQMQMIQTTSTFSLLGPTPVVTNLLTNVRMQIDYNYTPRSTGPEPVPEPATFGLLGMGLAALVVHRRSSLRRSRQIGGAGKV